MYSLMSFFFLASVLFFKASWSLILFLKAGRFLSVCVEVDAPIGRKGGCCPSWVKVLCVRGKASSLKRLLRRLASGHSCDRPS